MQDEEVRAAAAALRRHSLTGFSESADALEELLRLRGAIRAHRAQKADDRCVEDDDRLYAALGDGVGCDRRVGDKAEMLRSCARFIERRCEGGGWPTYAELEAECGVLRRELADAAARHAETLAAREAEVCASRAQRDAALREVDRLARGARLLAGDDE